jgi:hypothetical protein
MNKIIGFTITMGGELQNLTAGRIAQQQALKPFADLNRLSINVGPTCLEVWGHNNLSQCLHYLPDGSLLVLVGSPLGEFTWTSIQDSFSKISAPVDFLLPWDGRVILVKVDSDGRRWTMWNDWLGSIQVFYLPIDDGYIASTLEPVVVATAKLSSREIHLPSLISLLIHGHFLSDWTLYKDMRVIPPDCVAEWTGREFNYKQYFTVQPSEERWEQGWDDLVDEMHSLLRRAIAEVLSTQSIWILPLSGGLDSRLIAGVGAEMGIDMYAYTFGGTNSRDVIYARQVAETLGLPWKHLNLGAEYLVAYGKQWACLFGSAMYFHGMHQMKFLDELKTAPSGPIVSGFLGDALAGYDARMMFEFHGFEDRPQIIEEGYIHWSIPEIKQLLKVPTSGALEDLASEIRRSINTVSGARFQQLRYLILWSRQRFFTNFNATLCEYWRGVATPFLNKAYARFCYSLPRAVLDDRRLFVDMLQRYYPKMAGIAGTYWRPGWVIGEPLRPSGGYFLKRRLANKLPTSLQVGPLMEFRDAINGGEQSCFRKGGWSSLWPIKDVWSRLEDWVYLDAINKTYQTAISGDPVKSARAIQKLQTVQTLAYRFLDA